MPNQKCSQHECEKQATVEVFWPGKVPPPVYCEEHASQALGILEALGYSTAVRRIPGGDDAKAE